jgi:hypothetical protein
MGKRLMKSKKNKKFQEQTLLNKTRKMRKLNCSPKKNPKNFTCYTDKSLHKLKKYWNMRHPDRKITSNNSVEIWQKLRNYMNDICSTEACWLRQKFIENNLDKDLRSYTFAPKSPASWKKNKNEWLSSVDIEKVMKQFEETYPGFVFIGPTPIDFDKKKLYNNCVWNELCNFDLKNYIKQNKKMIGVVFNMDPHYKSGSHWMCMMIDIPKSIIYYFDSNGDRHPKEIKKLFERIQQQGKPLGIDFKFYENHPFEHQKGNTECGIYVLYFLIEILKGNKDYKYFTEQKITDDEMEKYRKIFFNDDL